MPRTSRRIWPILLSVSEAAQALRVNRQEIYDAIASGALPPRYTRGVRKWLRTRDVEAWVETWPQDRIKQKTESPNACD